MTQFELKTFYTRNKPHIIPPDGTFFVTFRLAGSIPKVVLKAYKNEKAWLESHITRLERVSDVDRLNTAQTFYRKWFVEFERISDQAESGPLWLGKPEIRKIVANKLIEGDPDDFILFAYSIMSNHVHVVFKPKVSLMNVSESRNATDHKFITSEKTFSRIMQGIKGGTARDANIILGRGGQFWERESYDHLIRDESEFFRTIKYTINNPVKAGLVQSWQDWPGNYLREDLLKRFL